MELSFLGDWFSQNATQLSISVVVMLVYFVLDRLSTPKFEKSAYQGRFKTDASNRAIRLARLITGIFGLLILLVVWGIDLNGVFLFATTTITLLGVALFASWSLLSNVTSYFVLLLQPSFKRGNFIRVIDADNYAEGYIADLTLFNTKLVTENREIIVYPNNLVIGRPTVINPRDRLDGVGKITTQNQTKTKEADPGVRM